MKVSSVIHILFLLFAGGVLFTCSNDSVTFEKKTPLSNYEKLEQYCSNKKLNLRNYKRVIVINEIGTCLNCNNIFSRSQSKNVGADSTLFIVSGAGSRVDLSAYISNNSKDLIVDEFADFDTLKIVKTCAILTLYSNTIQSIEEINIQSVYNISERKY